MNELQKALVAAMKEQKDLILKKESIESSEKISQKPVELKNQLKEKQYSS